MRKPFTLLLAPTLILTLGWVGLSVAEDSKSVASKSNSGSSPAGESQAPVEGKFVVHEWGTFTTFSGSNGVFLDFRPLANEASDLPPFVLNRASNTTQFRRLKTLIRGRVRMETPVTYFYTDRIRDVDVSVDFPSGLLTEFYPPVREMLPAFNKELAYGEGEPLGKSRLDWGTVTLLPTSALVPGIEDPNLRQEIAGHLAREVLPTGSNDHHYTQARATDSALVHVRGNAAGSAPRLSFLEKFLFYRGVGNFELPYRTEFRDNQIVVTNDGHLPMNSAILIQVEGEKMRTASINQIDAG